MVASLDLLQKHSALSFQAGSHASHYRLGDSSFTALLSHQTLNSHPKEKATKGNNDASDAPPSFEKLATRVKNDTIVKTNDTGLSYKGQSSLTLTLMDPADKHQRSIKVRDHIMDMDKRHTINGYDALKARKELFLMAFPVGKPPA